MNSLKLTAQALLFAFTFVPFAAAHASAQPVTMASLLEQMADVRNLPKFRNYTTHYTCLHRPVRWKHRLRSLPIEGKSSHRSERARPGAR